MATDALVFDLDGTLWDTTQTCADGDREAADANGIRFVHATYGFGRIARCDHRIDRFEELVALIA